jgi:hypothetical protein
MIPDSVSPDARANLLDPAIMGPPIVWLASERSDGVTGRRFVAARWRADLPEAEAAAAAAEAALATEAEGAEAAGETIAERSAPDAATEDAGEK